MTLVAEKPRRRDAEATKEAIQDAATARFAEASYDQVSLREIAALAGVDVALIGRYFGSKEELFAAIVSGAPRPHPGYPEDRDSFGEWMARRILSKKPDIARMLVLHHSVANPRAAAIVRKLMTERMIEPLGQWIGGHDGRLRASLIVAHLTGLGLMRDVIGLSALVDADREEMVGLLAPALQSYIDGRQTGDGSMPQG